MSEETKTEHVEEQPVKLSAAEIREHELFKKQAKLTSEYKSKLEQYEAQAAKAEQERQAKLLQEQGNFEQLLKQKEQEVESLQKQFQRELAKEKLSNALLSKGLNHPVALKSAVADYDYETDLSEYVDSLLQSPDYQIFFHGAQPDTKVSLPGSVSVSKSSQNWSQVKADLQDPKKAKQAGALVEEYFHKNGKLPW